MIWYVEDDGGIRDIGMYALQAAGFSTRGFEDGLSFWEALTLEKPRLVVLDVMLPGIDGIELLKKMKASSDYHSIPVIMATAKGQEYDRIRGLDLGADDYLVKPFSMLEMVSRVKAVLRRSQPSSNTGILQSGALSLNDKEHTVYLDNSRVQLTYKEFALLRIFLSHPGVVYTREQLFSRIWNTDYMGDSRTLDSHIKTLRQKLSSYGKCIETVRNVGYRWEDYYGK